MRSIPATTLLIAVAAPFAASQSLSELPPCAQNAGLASIQQSGCTVTDVACLCSKASVIDSLRAAILQACSAEDQTAAQAFADTLCGAAGSSSMDPAAPTSMPDMSSMPESTPESTPASMPDGAPESMMSSMSSASVAYTAHADPSASTTSMMNMTMHTPSSSASGNSSMSSTSMDMSKTSSPSQFTGGAPSRASSLEREWLLPAVAIAGIMAAAF